MRWLVATAMLVLSTAPAMAQDRLDELATMVNQSTATPRGEDSMVERMAKLVRTSADELRAEQTSSGLGWGDLFLAHRIAARGGHPVGKVIAARRTGASWTQIAEEARVDPDALVADVGGAWPDAARSVSGVSRAAPTPAASPDKPDAKPRSGGLLDFLRGKAGGESDDRASPPPTSEPRDDITERMLRGAGQKQR
jgi:hypothetical protein